MALTASRAAKKAGLKRGLIEVTEMTHRNPQLLIDWFHKRRDLFDIVIAGCVVIKARRSSDEWLRRAQDLKQDDNASDARSC